MRSLFTIFVFPAEMVLKLLQLENLLSHETTSQPDDDCDPGSYLSQTGSVSLIPHSPPAFVSSKQQKEAKSSLWSAGLTREECNTSLDLFDNPVNEAISQSKEIGKAEKKNLLIEKEEVDIQNHISSNPLTSPSVLKKTIENRLNLSHIPVSPSGTSSEIGFSEKLLDEADVKTKLTYTTHNKGKQRKKCASKVKKMLQNKKEMMSENMTEKQENKTNTIIPGEDLEESGKSDKTNTLSGKVQQLYKDFGRAKNKQMNSSTCSENSYDENILEQNKNDESTHELSNTVQANKKKKALVPPCDRREKPSLSNNTVSKLMKFAFDDSKSSSASTSSLSVSESSENLNKSNVSDTVHPPLIFNPPLSVADPISSSSELIIPKCNETVNLSTTDLLSGHQWQTPSVNNQNIISQIQNSSTTSPSISTAQKFPDVKQKKQEEKLHHVSHAEGMNTSLITSHNPFDITLSSHPDFSSNAIHVSTPISATHTAGSATVTKRSSSLFEIDDDDLDLDLDFDIGCLQSDTKRTRLK